MGFDKVDNARKYSEQRVAVIQEAAKHLRHLEGEIEYIRHNLEKALEIDEHGFQSTPYAESVYSGFRGVVREAEMIRRTFQPTILGFEEEDPGMVNTLYTEDTGE